MSEWFNEVKENALMILKDQKYLKPTAIVLYENEQVMNIFEFPYKNEEERTKYLHFINSFCKENKAEKVVVICGVVARDFERKDVDYVMNNLETENPLMYPESMVKKAIAFYNIDFKDNNNTFLHLVFYHFAGDFLECESYEIRDGLGLIKDVDGLGNGMMIVSEHLLMI